MAHYCCKCLVNQVANEGDVCALCGGSDPANQGGQSNQSSYKTYDPQNQSTTPVIVRSGRRIMTGQGGQSAQAGQTSPAQGGQGAQTPSPAAQPAMSAKAAKKQARKQANAPIQGIVKSFDTGVDDRSFLLRVSDSLFKGISYNGKNNLVMTEFQLYQNWNAGYSAGNSSQPVATRVVCYGKIGQGRPVENNDVTVYGVKDKTNNYYIAEQIQNTTDGTFANFMPRKIPATVIRLIALAILLFIASLISGATLPVGGLFSISMTQVAIGLVLMLVGLVVCLIGKSSMRYRPSRKMLLISIGVLIILLGFFVLTVQNADVKFAKLGDALLQLIVYLVGFRLLVWLVTSLSPSVNITLERMVDVTFLSVGIIGAMYLAFKVFLT